MECVRKDLLDVSLAEVIELGQLRGQRCHCSGRSGCQKLLLGFFVDIVVVREQVTAHFDELVESFRALPERDDHSFQPLAVLRHGVTFGLNVRFDLLGELGQRLGLQIVRINPEEFFRIEHSGRFADVLQRKFPYQFLA